MEGRIVAIELREQRRRRFGACGSMRNDDRRHTQPAIMSNNEQHQLAIRPEPRGAPDATSEQFIGCAMARRWGC